MPNSRSSDRQRQLDRAVDVVAEERAKIEPGKLGCDRLDAVFGHADAGLAMAPP